VKVKPLYVQQQEGKGEDVLGHDVLQPVGEDYFPGEGEQVAGCDLQQQPERHAY